MNINGLGYAPYPKGHVDIFIFSEEWAKVSEKAEIPYFEPGKFRSFAEDRDILAVPQRVHTTPMMLSNCKFNTKFAKLRCSFVYKWF